MITMAYQPRHAKHPDPATLPPVLRGVADLIQVLDDSSDEK